ncbi:VRR-NUC domain-containing protein [Aureibacillus halotolerans]|uniref:VRR-NUC domain-containing protein n=1 Tax=Aureibacillus halotolerans TaxID=1508390 RepID=A0A4R6TZZ0_9BACI|nr:VRR-NUC domain-containing protein [Aureibacillus halotolerans]TDQ39221.1 hypothetical protein EV213_108173 [Aureibacillus halotolerans]
MRERQVEKYLKTNIERLGWKCLKFESPGYAGVPDRICLLPGGRTVYVECKRPGENLRKLQQKRKKDFEALGHEVFKVDDYDSVDRLIDRIK